LDSRGGGGYEGGEKVQQAKGDFLASNPNVMNLKILEMGVGVGNQANRNTGFMPANRKLEVGVYK
jgi:hypothetical protein